MYDQDRQAAEDDQEQFFGIIRLAYLQQVRHFYSDDSPAFRNITVPKVLTSSTMSFEVTFGTFCTHSLPATGGCIVLWGEFITKRWRTHCPHKYEHLCLLSFAVGIEHRMFSNESCQYAMVGHTCLSF